MGRKTLFVLLAAIAALLLAACGNGGAGPGGLYDPGNPSVHVPRPGEGITLPLVDEPVTFTIWAADPGLPAIGVSLGHETHFFRELERRTGIGLRFVHPPVGAEDENLALLIASGDYPHIININPNAFPGGIGPGIRDGTIIEVSGLARTYAPYYWEIINQSDEMRRQTTTDEGYVPGFFSVNQHIQPPWMGLVTRQDWLDELGLDTPETYDDWHNALSLFRDEMGARAPMLLQANGFHIFNNFNAGFGVINGFYQINGRVGHGILSDALYDYLVMMSRWYSEGLIDPDFSTRPGFFVPPNDLTATGIAGLWQDIYIMLPVNNMIAMSMGDMNYRSVGVPFPARERGQTVYLSRAEVLAEILWLITDNHPDPVTFTRLMNYLFSPEGAIFAMYGIEGDTFVFTEDGEPVFTERMYNHPSGWSLSETMRYYTRWPGGGMLYDWRREVPPGTDQDVLDTMEIWTRNVDFSRAMPPVTLTPEEGSEFARIMNDVETHVDEMVARFILGAEPLANFDSFINTIRSMDIDRAIELQQAALDRYYAR